MMAASTPYATVTFDEKVEMQSMVELIDVRGPRSRD